MNYIKLLRGSPLTVFLAILHLGGEAERRHIRRLTGYSYPTIDKACQELADAGLATRSSWGWHILEASPQLVLGENKKFLPDDVGINMGIESKSLNTTTSTNKDSLLRGVGIQNPTRQMLIEAPHVTEDYLEAHISQWKQERGVGVGVLINRLRENMPAPKNQNDYTGGEFADFVEH